MDLPRASDAAVAGYEQHGRTVAAVVEGQINHGRDGTTDRVPRNDARLETALVATRPETAFRIPNPGG